MLFLTRWFGVTESDAERNPAQEKADIEEIIEKVSTDAGECCHPATPAALSWNSCERRLRPSPIRST